MECRQVWGILACQILVEAKGRVEVPVCSLPAFLTLAIVLTTYNTVNYAKVFRIARNVE